MTDTKVDEPRNVSRDDPGVDLALERTAEGDRYRPDHPEAASGSAHHLLDVGPLLGAAALQILLRVRLGGRDEQADLVDAVAGVEIRQGALDCFWICTSGFIKNTRRTRQRSQQLGCVRKLRHH